MEDKVTRIYIYEWRERCDVDEIFLKGFAASVWVNSVFLGTSFGK